MRTHLSSCWSAAKIGALCHIADLVEDDDPAPKRSRTTRTQPVRSSRAAKKPQYVYTADSDSDLDMPIAIPTRKLAPAPARKTKRTAAPAATAARILQSPGLKKWNLDALKLTRVAKGEQKGCWTVEGYVGIEGDFSGKQVLCFAAYDPIRWYLSQAEMHSLPNRWPYSQFQPSIRGHGWQ